MSYNPYVEAEQRKQKKDRERAETAREVSEISGLCAGMGVKLFLIVLPFVSALWFVAKWLMALGNELGVK